jgi:hypothetical protein
MSLAIYCSLLKILSYPVPWLVGKHAPEGKSEPSPKRTAIEFETKIRGYINMNVGKVYLQLHVNLVLQYQL